MHPWHDVELGKYIETGFRAVIEIPKGEGLKGRERLMMVR
jgi:hypothetical protein